jgi:Mn2+/Fe2+ NRAMP family transporter
MFVGLYCILVLENQKPLPLIVAAQAVTVLASPLVGGALLWLTSNKDVMGKDVNGPILNVLGGVGFLMLLALSAKLAIYNVWPEIQKLLGS